MAKLAEVVICSEVLLGRRVRLGLGGGEIHAWNRSKAKNREERENHVGPANGERRWVPFERGGASDVEGRHLEVG